MKVREVKGSSQSHTGLGLNLHPESGGLVSCCMIHTPHVLSWRSSVSINFPLNFNFLTLSFCLIPSDGRNLNTTLKLSDWICPHEARGSWKMTLFPPVQSWCVWGCLDYFSFLRSLHILKTVCMNRNPLRHWGHFKEIRVKLSHFEQVTLRTQRMTIQERQMGRVHDSQQ